MELSLYLVLAAVNKSTHGLILHNDEGIVVHWYNRTVKDSFEKITVVITVLQREFKPKNKVRTSSKP